ncbi:hypothetical protein [Kitasatospora sp. NPDC094015]|uniref:hypothetical protein n=1 Tax=Kitasatospora sp. NPDC094015 TaxID=3155205 RepID=UPI003317489A
MNAECPKCATSDLTVGVPYAAADPGQPLRAQEYGLLLPPPVPAPATVERSKPAGVLYIVAGVIIGLWLTSVVRDQGDLEGANAAYRLGYIFGPLFLAVPLALTGLVVQLSTRPRRVRTAEQQAGARRALWERQYRVWQAAWWCRRCRVAFFPEGAVAPGHPASQAVPLLQFPMWVVSTAERVWGVPEPAPIR